MDFVTIMITLYNGYCFFANIFCQRTFPKAMPRWNSSDLGIGNASSDAVSADIVSPVSFSKNAVRSEAFFTTLSEKVVRLAQTMQVGPCIPVGIHL